MGSEYEPHNGFEKSAKFYLEAAHYALASDQPRLAIHLYRAAFEVESAHREPVSSAVVEGLRKAWDLACEENDRSAAESIFGELSSFNTIEQNEQAVMRLQSLALSQLEDMGITDLDIEHIASAVSQELDEESNPELFDSLKDVLGHLSGLADDEENGQSNNSLAVRKFDLRPSVVSSPSAGSTNGGLTKLNEQLQKMRKRNQPKEGAAPLNYQVLVGFDSAMEHMREYGFLSAGDEHFKAFVEQSAAMHGVAPLSIEDSFLFFGPSREDVSLFAHATAGEIDFPVINVVVDLDKTGNGTIKFAGPVKRNLFGGPFDLMNMPTPCIVLIENIDNLQKMFDNEQAAIKQNKRQFMPMMGAAPRSMQAEITGYLRALRQRPGVFVMATAEHTGTLKGPLLDLMGPLNEIAITHPAEKERRDVLHQFAEEHPSFADLDIDRLAALSEGLSRRELVGASSAAVELAYRESLRSGQYSKVKLADALLNMAPHLDHESPLYKRVEDEAVAQLYLDIEEDML
jgi:uncharacterized protein YjiS (DUF1127 family)